MVEQQSRRLVIVVTRNEHDDRSWFAFTIANEALSAGAPVGIFLASDGVELSRELGCDFADDVGSEKPFLEIVSSFVENGGVLWYCASCFRRRGLKRGETFKAAIPSDYRPMLDWIAGGAATLSF